jgi:PTS system galactitol-specific IIA component
MQYTLLELLDESHILVGLAAEDADAAIRALNDALAATGHTRTEFAEDACRRERTFPTGLPTQPVAIAIPHADPEHVLRSAVAIGTLRGPVSFGQMGTDGSTLLAVRAVFLLAIKEREKQVEMIQQLMNVIQNRALLGSLLAARDAGEALRLIREGVAG